jgi:glycine/sarcosine N-methyltransferase
MNTAESYDRLADHYDLIFEDWNAAIERQSETLSSVLLQQSDIAPGSRILDCGCGIGTQALGLANHGFRVSGFDISPNAIVRARQEASQRGLDIAFSVADMRELGAVAGDPFDAVICMDNVLPHLESEDDVRLAATQIHARLARGGKFLASIRDYDLLLAEKPVVQGPFFYSAGQSRRIVLQVWDWVDDRRYVFHLYITRRTGSTWETFHTFALYRAIRRDELTALLNQSGYRNVNWLLPAQSGFYQPIIVAESC